MHRNKFYSNLEAEMYFFPFYSISSHNQGMEKNNFQKIMKKEEEKKCGVKFVQEKIV